jgi:sigma-B regulation protein RsbU (phosphoserine phosphatase)
MSIKLMSGVLEKTSTKPLNPAGAEPVDAIRVKRGIHWKLLSTMMGLLVSVVFTLTFIGLVLQKNSLESELAKRVELMQANLLERGTAFSRLIESEVENDVAASNFSHIQEVLNQQDYAILMNTEGKAIIHSRHPELEQEKLQDENSRFALEQTALTHREYPEQDAIEFILPIRFGAAPWGVLRLGFSTEALKQEIARSEAEIETTRQRIILLAAGIAGFFIILGSGIVLFISNALSRPLIRLTQSVRALACGNFDGVAHLMGSGTLHRAVTSSSADEIDILAGSFVEMAGEIQRSREQLEEYNHTLEEKVKVRTEELVAAYQKQKELEEDILQESLRLATDIQMGMMSTAFPRFSRQSPVDLYAIMDPAKEVGGDFYDFFYLDECTLLIVIGDVAGKGMPGALFMVMVKTMIRAVAPRYGSPREILAAINPELCRDNDMGMFVTLFLATLDVETGRLIYSFGGHNRPLFLAQEGRAEMITGDAGMVVGIFDDMAFTQQEMHLKPGDGLVLYTDGVTEAMNLDSQLFSDQRLLDLMQDKTGKDAQELVEEVIADVRVHVGEAEQSDDITIMAVRRAFS